jgi:hypothetical protein
VKGPGGDLFSIHSTRGYFSDTEDQALPAAFWEFDRKTIHEKYKTVVEALDFSMDAY